MICSAIWRIPANAASERLAQPAHNSRDTKPPLGVKDRGMKTTIRMKLQYSVIFLTSVLTLPLHETQNDPKKRAAIIKDQTRVPGISENELSTLFPKPNGRANV